MTWIAKDGVGNPLSVGDVCFLHRRGKSEYCVYINPVWGAAGGKLEYGRFMTKSGATTVKTKNVLFAFDPLNLTRKPNIGSLVEDVLSSKRKKL